MATAGADQSNDDTTELTSEKIDPDPETVATFRDSSGAAALSVIIKKKSKIGFNKIHENIESVYQSSILNM